MTVDILDVGGNIRYSTPVNEGARGVCSLGGDDYITLPVNSNVPIPFTPGDYVDLRGAFSEALGGRLSKVYKLLTVPKPSVSPGSYGYELRFDAYYHEWNNKLFLYLPEGHGQEASWSLTATLDVHLGIFLRNLKARGYKYNGVDYTFAIDDTVENKAVAITYDNAHLLDALYSMASEDNWNCDCWITDNVIHFGRCEHGDLVDIRLGIEAESMSGAESSGTYATRIYAFGSDRNIPSDYRPVDEQTVVNGVVQRRLMLPEGTPYVDVRESLPDAEAVEAVKVFDDIYPRRVGTLSDVHTRTGTVTNDDGTTTTTTYYRYKDTGLTFDKKYILEGKELQITFRSGKLNGMTFGVIFDPTPKDSSRGEQLWEIVANEDYGRLLPDETICPADGDQYVLSGFNIQMVSDKYIPAAEQELLEAAKKYVARTAIDDNTYTVPLNSAWVHENMSARLFDLGQRVKLGNEAYFGADGRESRVIGWELKLDLPYDAPTYTIGESARYSRLSTVEDKVETLTYKGTTYSGGGSGVYVVRVNDSTPPSDSNVLSALRTLRQFVRKDADDTVAGLLSFAKGLQSDNFTGGTLGSGFGLFKDVDGKSYLELDRLYVRYKAIFDDLEVKHISHVGGEFVVSPAGMRCIRVEKLDGTTGDRMLLSDSSRLALFDSDGLRLSASATGTEAVYRCYFHDSDGERTIENQFAVGDLAMCREFNVKGNSANRYYWRKVTATGADYIDLSVTDCMAGSDEPQAGDDIVVVGNVSDISRQNAIVLSSYAVGAPSMRFYKGINSYSLDGKEVIIISPSGNKFTGQFTIEAGSAGLENMEEFSGLATRVAATEKGLQSTVSETVYNEDQKELQTKLTEITQNADNISLWVKNAGWENLLLNSGAFRSMRSWSAVGNAGTLELVTGDDGSLLQFTVTRAEYAWGHLIEQLAPATVFEDKAVYAVSVQCKVNRARQIRIGFRNDHGDFFYDKVFDATTEMQKFSYTFTYLQANHVQTGQELGAFIVAPQTEVPEVGDAIQIKTTLLQKSDKNSQWLPSTADTADGLRQTGIDIEEGRITLRGDNVYINDSNGNPQAVISGGKLSIELIDVNSLIAKRLATAESGKRIVISDNVLTMYDGNGQTKLVVSGDNLSESTDGSTVKASGATLTGESDGSDMFGGTTEEHTLATFEIASGNNIVTYPKFILSAIATNGGLIGSGSTMTASMVLYLDGVEVGRATKTAAANSVSDEREITIDTRTLSTGTHRITARGAFNGYGTAVDFSGTAAPVGEGQIGISYVSKLTEIAANGFRTASGANKYLMHTEQGTEMRDGNYGLKVTSKGIMKMTDGINWTAL